MKPPCKLNTFCVLTRMESRSHLGPNGFGRCSFLGGGSVVVDAVSIVAPIVCWGTVFGTCSVVLSILSSFAIILVRKRELVALLLLSF